MIGSAGVINVAAAVITVIVAAGYGSDARSFAETSWVSAKTP
jgi:hypothetical protein